MAFIWVEAEQVRVAMRVLFVVCVAAFARRASS